MNPNMKVPVLKDADYILYESHAIVRYLGNKFNIDNDWYPNDAKIKGKID